mmetsp:Transcript_33466/g.105427  ORF Transcript_33466/g.105427 Transcript_33466/m.105427 type:complete len:246 (-) Transcript_33466:30-767(-)
MTFLHAQVQHVRLRHRVNRVHRVPALFLKRLGVLRKTMICEPLLHFVSILNLLLLLLSLRLVFSASSISLSFLFQFSLEHNFVIVSLCRHFTDFWEPVGFLVRSPSSIFLVWSPILLPLVIILSPSQRVFHLLRILGLALSFLPSFHVFLVLLASRGCLLFSSLHLHFSLFDVTEPLIVVLLGVFLPVLRLSPSTKRGYPERVPTPQTGQPSCFPGASDWLEAWCRCSTTSMVAPQGEHNGGKES